MDGKGAACSAEEVRPFVGSLVGLAVWCLLTPAIREVPAEDSVAKA